MSDPIDPALFSTSPSVSFVLDTVAAAALLAALARNTDASQTDRITKDASVVVSGVESGARLSCVVDGGPASASYNAAALTR